eukprot:scaffold287_cov337-Pavlova_lutheri.AAC.231
MPSLHSQHSTLLSPCKLLLSGELFDLLPNSMHRAFVTAPLPPRWSVRSSHGPPPSEHLALSCRLGDGTGLVKHGYARPQLYAVHWTSEPLGT